MLDSPKLFHHPKEKLLSLFQSGTQRCLGTKEEFVLMQVPNPQV